MPSAAPDTRSRARFTANLDAVLSAAGLPADAALGLALSGGPDSCALLLLAGARVKALTVDHGLRAGATAEAAAAAALCAAHGVPHETVRVTVGAGSVQAAARQARYRALAAWAAREGLAAVLTAHHADDQAETLLMRLARGAGLAGLSGIRPVQPFHHLPDHSRESGNPVPPAPTSVALGSRVRGNDAKVSPTLLVLRPLLGWRKAELEAICAAAGVTPARDPSNTDPRYDRTAARALLAATPWLDPVRLAAAAAHLAEADAALAAIADARFAPLDDGDGLLLRPDPLREITRRHLRRLLADRFGAHPDGPSLDRALAVLEGGGATTCADILCRAEPPLWRFRRAPPRRRPG